jgi:purine-binding chemotaxis protein CheW
MSTAAPPSPPTPESPPVGRACLFSLAGEDLAVDVKHAREIVVLDGYTVVPLAPPHLIGVANLRGYVLPIVDLRLVLGLPAHRVGRGSKVLVIGTGSLQVAMVVDAVLGLEWFGEPRPLDETARGRFGALAVGLLPQGDRWVTLLDAQKVLEALRTERTRPKAHDGAAKAAKAAKAESRPDETSRGYPGDTPPKGD